MLEDVVFWETLSCPKGRELLEVFYHLVNPAHKILDLSVVRFV